MIPVYRSTLTRIDLSNVLSYMVENSLEGETAGQQLAKELAAMCGFDGAVALRTPLDAVLYAMELLECDSVLMPVLAPHVLSSRLRSLGKQIQYYDVDADSMTPIFHPDYPINYTDNMLKINLGYFGVNYNSYVQSNAKLVSHIPQEFIDIPSIEIAWSLDCSSIFSNVQKKKSSKKDKSEQETIEDTRASIADYERPAFKIILLENNTLCTAGGGAILLTSGKKVARVLEKKVSHLRSWQALTDFNASLALAQLRQIEEFASRVTKLMPLYTQAIQRTRHSALPIIYAQNAMPQCFPIMISSRVNEVVKYIRKQGIESEFPFLSSVLGIMMEKLVSDKERTLAVYTHGAKYVTNVIVLPLYSALDKDEVSKIINVISTLP